MQHQYTKFQKIINDSRKFFALTDGTQADIIVRYCDLAQQCGVTLGKRDQFALACEVHAVLVNAADFAWTCGRWAAAQALQTAANMWYTHVVCYR